MATRELHDYFFKQAKRDGYLSRAAYKLIEIDDKRKILRPGACVLDAGAAPGSWVQVAAKRVGEKGCVVAIDLDPLAPAARRPGVHAIVGDLREIPTGDLLAPLAGTRRRRFDVVLSDMAPRTTGQKTIDHHQSVRLCEAVLDRLRDLLATGGDLVMKVFEGEAYADLVARTATVFETVKGFKPQASRDVSREMYVIARRYVGAAADTPPPEDPGPAPAPPRPAPGRGWGH